MKIKEQFLYMLELVVQQVADEAEERFMILAISLL
jgi:hypothetical protein